MDGFDGLEVANHGGNASTYDDDELPPWKGTDKGGRPSNAQKKAWEEYKAAKARGENPEYPGVKPDRKPVNLFDAMPKAPPSAKPKAKKNLDGVKQTIIAMHAMIALKTSSPELALDQDEAALLAESGSALLDYYKVKVDGKNGAIIGLVYAITIIYMPRIVQLVIRTKAAREDEARQQQQPVTSEFP